MLKKLLNKLHYWWYKDLYWEDEIMENQTKRIKELWEEGLNFNPPPEQTKIFVCNPDDAELFAQQCKKQKPVRYTDDK